MFLSRELPLTISKAHNRCSHIYSFVAKFFILFLLCHVSWADNPQSSALSRYQEPKFLAMDEAFQFSHEIIDNQVIRLHWNIAQGYYLYQKQLAYSLQDIDHLPLDNLGTVTIPEGLPTEDEIFGKVTIYRDNLTIDLPLSSTPLVDSVLLLRYQGCADAGLCYPPNKLSLPLNFTNKSSEKKNLNPHTPANIERNLLTFPASGNSLNQFLTTQSVAWSLITFFILGIGLAFTPCVLPMLPILSSLIFGQQQLTSRQAFGLALTYVAGMSITYTAAGVLAGLFGASANIPLLMQHPVTLVAFSLLFAALALSMFGLFNLQLPNGIQNRLNKATNQQEGGSYLGVATMGALSALVVSPCLSAPLAGALAYISTTGDATLGGLALLALSLGMGVPLLILAIGGQRLLPKNGPWMESVKTIMGLALLGVSLWLLARLLPATAILASWASLALITAYLLELFSKHSNTSKKIFALTSASIIGLIGFQQWQLNNHQTSNTAPESVNAVTGFLTLTDAAQLAPLLEQAKSNKQIVIIDFYADWCTSCHILEKEVFSHPSIKSLLSPFILIKMDVTTISTANQELLEQFQVPGLPSILIIGTDGNEQRASRIEGEMNAKEFTLHINTHLDIN